MSAPAAISGTFADFRIVKGRKVAQLVVEVPLEQADAALACLGGLPRPDAERWVAVARLNTDPGASSGQDGEAQPLGTPEGSRPVASPSAPKRQWHELPASQQAAMRCDQEPFWDYVRQRLRSRGTLVSVSSVQDCARHVRELCRVESRKHLDTEAAAASRWYALDRDFQVATGRLAHDR